MSLDWMSDQQMTVVLAAKGIAAFAAFILAIVHMNQKLHYIETTGQKLRYWILMGYALLTCFSTAEQIQDHIFGYWIFFSLAINLAMCYVMIVSIKEHRAHKDAKEY